MGLVHKIPHLIHPERRVPWKIQLIRYSYVETPRGIEIIDPDEQIDDLSESYVTVIIRLDTTQYGRYSIISHPDIQTTDGLLNPLAALGEDRPVNMHELFGDLSISTNAVPLLFTGFWWSRQAKPQIVRLPIYKLKLHLEI